jgi:cytochrome P450 family 4
VLRKWGVEYYPIYKSWAMSVAVANLMSPEDMKVSFKTTEKKSKTVWLQLILTNIKHMKKSPIYDSLKKWLGTGILTSSGTKWQTRRKILTSAFHFKILQDFIEIFNEKTEEMVEVLKRECDNTCTEISPIITHFALKIIGGEEMYIYALD